MTTVYVARRPGAPDPLAAGAARKLGAAGLTDLETGDVRVLHTRVYVLEGMAGSDDAAAALRDLLCDPVAEVSSQSEDPSAERSRSMAEATGRRSLCLQVGRRPGVTDAVEASVRHALELLGHPIEKAHTLDRYWLALPPGTGDAEVRTAAERWLANDVIEEVKLDPPPPGPRATPPPYRFERVVWPIREAGDDDLLALGREHTLSLTLEELHAIRDHFRELGRDPTDVEVETLAQTWSEHCKHKTLTGLIEMDGRLIDNLLKSTIMRVTRELDRDWCWSVFSDNAGVIAFDDDLGVAFKVETHNHPSAIEPYGGAGTGIGGVIRDIMGTGLGARPIANTDVFAFGHPDMPADAVPKGALHPRRVLEGVVAGVRDYGNRMGIPTVSGGVYFDDRYTGNPLVFCGTVGVIAREHVDKSARPGDLIVTAGGRTGRDGIHGATFSSVELTEDSETVSSGAVQIGDPITEKKVLDVQLQARDAGLYTCITDCGAGGYSSAVGEMGEHTGARVHLDSVPLKYSGLTYTEAWISEAQERMVMAVPPANVDRLLAMFAAEDVEACVLGEFTDTGRLELFWGDEQVADLSMGFVHDGVPRSTRLATWTPPDVASAAFPMPRDLDLHAALRSVLASPTVASKEWIIRQYDHEVQGGTVGKPLVGAHEDGPADAAVLLPRLGDLRAVAIACGCNPAYGDLDPYRMGKWVVDEAVRNLVAVGAPLDRVAILDNFAWGNCARPEQLGSLVLAAEGAAEAALAYGTPFISGKDSLNNEFATSTGVTSIPPTLLISGIAVMPDASLMLSMDLKAAGNALYLIGETREELGGSQLGTVLGIVGGSVPDTHLDTAMALYRALTAATAGCLVRSLHDLSEGGLAVAAAEMAFAGDLGARVDLAAAAGSAAPMSDAALLFSETPSRFLAEVEPESVAAFEEALRGHHVARVGEVTAEPVLRVVGQDGGIALAADVNELKACWQRPLAEGASEPTSGGAGK